MLSPFRMVCRDFILPEPASYVFFYAVFNLRNLLYIIYIIIVHYQDIEKAMQEAEERENRQITQKAPGQGDFSVESDDSKCSLNGGLVHHQGLEPGAR